MCPCAVGRCEHRKGPEENRPLLTMVNPALGNAMLDHCRVGSRVDAQAADTGATRSRSRATLALAAALKHAGLFRFRAALGSVLD